MYVAVGISIRNGMVMNCWMQLSLSVSAGWLLWRSRSRSTDKGGCRTDDRPVGVEEDEEKEKEVIREKVREL